MTTHVPAPVSSRRCASIDYQESRPGQSLEPDKAVAALRGPAAGRRSQVSGDGVEELAVVGAWMAGWLGASVVSLSRSPLGFCGQDGRHDTYAPGPPDCRALH